MHLASFSDHVLSSDEKIQALVSRLSTLENSVRSTHRTPSISTDPAVNNSSITPEPRASSDRPLKRKRTESSINPTANSDADPTQQSATEARTLISKELSTNDLLSPDQRSVLEKAISFVDHLSHAPTPAITDRSTFDKTLYGSTPLSQGEILHVILCSGCLQKLGIRPSLIFLFSRNE